MSHTAADAGYVLVVPLGGIIFRSGSSPSSGYYSNVAGVSGGFLCRHSSVLTLPAVSLKQRPFSIFHTWLTSRRHLLLGLSSVLIVLSVCLRYREVASSLAPLTLPVDEDAEQAPDLSTFSD
ncbi:AbgT family transporter [Vibrio lentus]|nr:AbgT family transporter [Vibrio lentus]